MGRFNGSITALDAPGAGPSLKEILRRWDRGAAGVSRARLTGISSVARCRIADVLVGLVVFLI